MGKIAYYVNNDKTKLYLNIVENFRCSNRCVFCDINLLQDAVGNDLRLNYRPNSDEINKEVDKELSENKNAKEVIFCGICEPTFNLDTMIEVIKNIKAKYGLIIRLNTNGHGALLNKNRLVAKELKKAGLDIVNVSLNALDEESYNKLHNPSLDDSFNATQEFIKNAFLEGIKVRVSFIKFEELDKKKAISFVKENLGLSEENIIFRKKIEK